MKKRNTFRQHLQRTNKTSDFVPVPIQYLSNRLLTLVQEGKVNSKLYRNTVTYIVTPEILSATLKSLTNTPKSLDCETPVNINSEQLASPPSTPRVSTPNAVKKMHKNLLLLIRHAPFRFLLLL